MGSTFFGLELSRRALSAQQVALDITGHNIANANTPGYTRQIGTMTTTTPDTISRSGKNMSVGSGVTLDTITRARDAFVDRQFRTETSKQQYWGTKQENLTQVENILNEPSDTSLSNDMSEFWNAWSDLSLDPENTGVRSVVSERAQALTDNFHNMAQQTNDLMDNAETSIKTQITQINSFGQQLSDLNNQIKQAEIAGDNPNDLRDKRDALVDDLSKIVNVRVVETKDPTYTNKTVNNYKVTIGNENSTNNNILVDGSAVRLLEDPPPQDTENSNLSQVVWSDDLTEVDLGDKQGALYAKQGTLSANIEARDQDLPKFMDQIDTLAQGIASAVNALHQIGQGLNKDVKGINFFTDGSDDPQLDPQDLPLVTAATITLNSVIAKDVDNIATGAITSDDTVVAGDGTIAEGISSLSSGWNALKDLIAQGKFGVIDGVNQNPVSSTSLTNLYTSNVAQLGVDAQQANRMKAGEDLLVANVTNQRASLSGISLDEEMTNLVKFQKSYAAAARMVTMMDDMLSTILSMGITK